MLASIQCASKIFNRLQKQVFIFLVKDVRYIPKSLHPQTMYVCMMRTTVSCLVSYLKSQCGIDASLEQVSVWTS